MSLLDWILGRGRNPLEPEGSSATSPAATSESDQVDDAELLRHRANALGVDVETMQTMLQARDELLELVAADPRAWGMDLLPAHEARKDLATEYRQRTRLAGTLGESFLTGYDPLLALVPSPPTMPDGTPLDRHLQANAALAVDAARDIAQHVRTTIQAQLGAPLQAADFEHAVREAAWDHELDAAQVTPYVLRAVEALL